MSRGVDKRENGSIAWENVRRLLGVAVGAIGLAALGLTAERGLDGGFIKQAWEALKVPSPTISMVTTVALYTVWKAWKKDRQEHAERTVDYVIGMNTAARLRESDKREKARLREEKTRAEKRIVELERAQRRKRR